MRQQIHRQYKESFPEVMTNFLPFAERKLNCDSRYRGIIAQLDVMIESLRIQPGRKLTTELDQLMDAMMRIIGTENSYMALVDYPETAKHHNNHFYLFIITDDLNNRFIMGHDVLLEELTNVRMLWLLHIEIHDRAFEEYLII